MNQSKEQVLVADGGKSSAAMLIASMYGLAAGMGVAFPTLRTRSTSKQRKPVPMMVTASREEIAAWNAKVDQRKAAKWAVKLERRAIDAAMQA